MADAKQTDESGWVWFIPLHNGSVSVGVVEDKDIAAKKRKQYAGDHREQARQFYLDELKRTPGVMKFIGDARLMKAEDGTQVKTTSDFSYAATSYAGDHYRMAGDAAGV